MTGGPEDQARIPKLAIASYFLSFSSLLLGPLGFIPGILCGHLSRRRTARDPTLEDPGFAKSGLILGYTFYGLSLVALGLVLLHYSLYKLPHAPLTASQLREAEVDLDTLEVYLDRYRKRTGAYPTTAQQLEALYKLPSIEPIPPNWQYFLPPQYTIDPWGQFYRYRSPGIRNPQGYDLWCLGPDREEGTADDTIAR